MKSIKIIIIAAFIISLSWQFGAQAGEDGFSDKEILCMISHPYANDPLVELEFLTWSGTDTTDSYSKCGAVTDKYYATLEIEEFPLHAIIDGAREKDMISSVERNSKDPVYLLTMHPGKKKIFLEMIKEKSINFQKWEGMKPPDKEKKGPYQDWNIPHAGANYTRSGQILKK